MANDFDKALLEFDLPPSTEEERLDRLESQGLQFQKVSQFQRQCLLDHHTRIQQMEDYIKSLSDQLNNTQSQL
jgi:hypothetical protein